MYDYERSIKTKLEMLLKSAPVVLLQGARQSGKSTLADKIAKQSNEFTYITLDDNRYLSQAFQNPQEFVLNLHTPIIIDEVQRAPEIFLPIKLAVDRDRKPGKFLLTGSAQVLLLPKLADTLAGRLQILTMYPLSQSEIARRHGSFLDFAFSNEPLPKMLKQSLSREELMQKITIGGFPEVVRYASVIQRENWFSSYVSTMVHRDIREIAEVDRLATIPDLLAHLATRLAGLLNNADLSSVSGIPQTSLARYIALLQAIFAVHLLRPWSSNLTKRLTKTPKLFFNDSGLASYLLGISSPEDLSSSVFLGPLLENFVFSELLKQSTWSSDGYNLHHFRTHKGVEVDFIISKRPNKIVGIEVKSARAVTYDDFRGLRYLQNNYEKQFHRGFLLYGGDEIISFGKDLWCLPVNALWELLL